MKKTDDVLICGNGKDYVDAEADHDEKMRRAFATQHFPLVFISVPSYKNNFELHVSSLFDNFVHKTDNGSTSIFSV